VALTVEQEQHGSRRILIVDGELDLVTAPQLTSVAFTLAESGEPDVIIDAQRLEFCDSAGLTAFVRVANRLQPSGGRLAIAGPNTMVRRVLEVSGLVEAFLVVDRVADAVTMLERPE
jgi:anti-sigma B factor antagonist